MTTDVQRSSGSAAAVQHAASVRKDEFTAADEVKSASYNDANRAFVDAVRPIIDAGDMTVAEVAAAAEINRVRMYELLRRYPAIES